MLTSLVLGAALAAPGAPVPRDTEPAPTGPAPWVLYLKADDAGRAQVMVYKNQKVTQSRSVIETVDGKPTTKIVQEEVERMVASYVALDTINPKFTTAQGATLTTDSVMKRAKTGFVVLVSADGKPVSKSWLRTIDPEAVIATADGLVSPVAPRAITIVPTAAPRLVLLGTGTNGKVQIAYNAAGGGNNGYGGGQFIGGNRVVFINNGNGMQQVFLGDDGGYYSNPNATPVNAEAPVKSLEDAKFEAYDLNGKTVAKADALKRLKAGGFVLIAGDNRVPDASYLKLFRGDLLVLVSPELLNVPTGIKGVAKPAVGQPALLPAAPAPAVAPAKPLLLKPAVIRVAPLRVQPLKEVPAPPAEKKSR